MSIDLLHNSHHHSQGKRMTDTPSLPQSMSLLILSPILAEHHAMLCSNLCMNVVPCWSTDFTQKHRSNPALRALFAPFSNGK